MTPELSRTLNAIGMLAVSLVLLLAYVYQLKLYELPCPLVSVTASWFCGSRRRVLA